MTLNCGIEKFIEVEACLVPKRKFGTHVLSLNAVIYVLMRAKTMEMKRERLTIQKREGEPRNVGNKRKKRVRGSELV